MSICTIHHDVALNWSLLDLKTNMVYVGLGSLESVIHVGIELLLRMCANIPMLDKTPAIYIPVIQN